MVNTFDLGLQIRTESELLSTNSIFNLVCAGLSFFCVFVLKHLFAFLPSDLCLKFTQPIKVVITLNGLICAGLQPGRRDIMEQ